MKNRITSKEYRKLIGLNPRMTLDDVVLCDKKSKYGNQKTYYRSRHTGIGRNYASKLEAEFAMFLDNKQEDGRIDSWLAQVRFDLSDHERHYVDFCVFSCLSPDEQIVDYIEIKGIETPQGRRKRELTEKIYRIKINVIRSKSEFF